MLYSSSLKSDRVSQSGEGEMLLFFKEVRVESEMSSCTRIRSVRGEENNREDMYYHRAEC
jgi:hypothetical protein